MEGQDTYLVTVEPPAIWAELGPIEQGLRRQIVVLYHNRHRQSDPTLKYIAKYVLGLSRLYIAKYLVPMV